MRRSMVGHMLGMGLAVAAASMMVPRIAVEKRADKRDKEVSPHGPEVSRQVRRKLERQQLKKGYRR